MSGLSDTQESEVEQNGQTSPNPSSKEIDGKLESWKEDEEKDEGDDDEEEEDVDFNPFLIAETASEASSSLSSEDEGSVDSSRGRLSLHSHRFEHRVYDAAKKEGRSCDKVHGSRHREGFHTRQLSEGLSEKNTDVDELDNKQQSDTGHGEGFVSLERNSEGNVSGNETESAAIEQIIVPSPSRKSILKSGTGVGGEDAICMRTRARHSLAHYTLEELETFLQESDDDEDLQNVDDEGEYRKFLAAVLSGGNEDGMEKGGDENIDEDEESDADFEIEIEEALESDVEENANENNPRQDKYREDGQGPETRQKRYQRSSIRNAKKLMGQANAPLRRILPFVAKTNVDPVFLSHGWHSPLPKIVPHSSPEVDVIYGFTAQQIGQLFCLIHEHVQLLIQVFSLSVHDPTRQHIASKMQMLIAEMINKREEALAWRKVPYPVICFDHLQFYQSTYSDPLQSQKVSSSWSPSISNRVLSTLDVESLTLAKNYVADVSASRRIQVEGSQSQLKREPIFALEDYAALQETSTEVGSGNNTISGLSDSSVPSPLQTKKSLAATLVERTKRQSIALVPSDIASLAKVFYPLFNPALFPHKPPPLPVANRVLFTDSEDGLLAMGIMEYNNDWGAIQQRFLPCKSKHQIFVRQKNRSSSKASENPIKAVRRKKTSPLTADEKVLIAEGLKLFKHEWISVWKLFVPHRDPSLLPRQWRIATGTQKSYKKDEIVNEKRRLCEAKRRKLKTSMTRWHALPEYEADDNGSYIATDNVENEDEAYVHEAFLADVEPGNCKQSSSKLGCSGIDKRCSPSTDISPHKDTASCEDVSTVTGQNTRLVQIGRPFCESSNSLKLGNIQQLHTSGVSSAVSSGWLPLTSMSSTTKVSSTYRMRKRKGAQVVKLAPELPPVNLPPSVRVISQSAFRSYHSISTSMVYKAPGNILLPRLPHASNYRTVRVTSGKCQPLSCSNLVKANPGRDVGKSPDHHPTEENNTESDIQMHPLLFQISDADHPLYYTRDSSSTASRSFDFLAAGYQGAKLRLFQEENSDSMASCMFPVIQSKETHLGRLTIDFHPLLQRTDGMYCDPSNLCKDKTSEPELSQHNGIQFLSSPSNSFLVQQQANNDQSANTSSDQYEKDNELDLDIHLYSATNNASITSGKGATSQTIGFSNLSKLGPQTKGKLKRTHISLHSDNVKNDAISTAANSTVFKQNTTGLNHETRVCTKISTTDSLSAVSPGNGAYTHANDVNGDQLSPEIVMEQEELSDSDEEADNVEFECEEMDDSEGEELDCQQLDKTQ